MDFFDDEQGTDDALLTNQNLIDTQQKLGTLLDLMPTGLIIHQLQGILYANQQALALFEETAHDIVGKHILDFVEEPMREQSTEMFMSAFQQDKAVRFPEITLQVPSVKRILQVTAGRLPWEGTTVIQILLEDITELKWQTEELRRLTFSDPLTGAFNRRFFIQNAETSLLQSIRDKTAFSLLTFDIDWFKKVNDTYGHLAGDEALKTITRVWKETTRHSDDKDRTHDRQLARIGGEEFAVFFPGLSLTQARGIAERMRQNLAKTKIHYDDTTFSISASFGVTTRLDEDKNIDDLIRRADRALYRAKENGRNRVECE